MQTATVANMDDYRKLNKRESLTISGTIAKLELEDNYDGGYQIDIDMTVQLKLYKREGVVPVGVMDRKLYFALHGLKTVGLKRPDLMNTMVDIYLNCEMALGAVDSCQLLKDDNGSFVFRLTSNRECENLNIDVMVKGIL